MRKAELLLNISVYEHDYNYIVRHIDDFSRSKGPWIFRSCIIACGHVARRFKKYPAETYEAMKRRSHLFHGHERQIKSLFEDIDREIRYFMSDKYEIEDRH